MWGFHLQINYFKEFLYCNTALVKSLHKGSAHFSLYILSIAIHYRVSRVPWTGSLCEYFCRSWLELRMTRETDEGKHPRGARPPRSWAGGGGWRTPSPIGGSAPRPGGWSTWARGRSRLLAPTPGWLRSMTSRASPSLLSCVLVWCSVFVFFHLYFVSILCKL